MPLENKKELVGLLRKSGLRVTKSRLAIISTIKEAQKPISPQEIIEKIGKKFNPATVYRFINKLKFCGIIRQIDLRQNSARYEMADLRHHHHLVCVRCGKIENIDGCELEGAYKSFLEKTKKFSKICEHSLEFFGICKECE